MTSATGKYSSSSSAHLGARGCRAFTLVELLSVVAIMAIIMGALGYSISNMGGPSTQVAAAQVASGLSLARQYAVAKNLETRFIICNLQGATGPGLPPESWRYWTIIQTNRGNKNWTMLKEWEKLPAGVVFLNIAQSAYSVIAGDPIATSPGTEFDPVFSDQVTSGLEWKTMQSFTNNFDVVVAGKNFNLKNTPCFGFRGLGEAVRGNGSSFGIGGGNTMEVAVRVASGVVTPAGKILIKATNNYYYVETDKRGRVRVRPPESYRN